MNRLLTAVAAIAMLGTPLASLAAYTAPTVQAEKLGRGLNAVYDSKGRTGVHVSWRSLLTDSKTLTWDLYRNGTKVNKTPLTVTSYLDASGTATSKYVVKGYVDGELVETSAEITPWPNIYKSVKMQQPPGGTYSNISTTQDKARDGDGNYVYYYPDSKYYYAPGSVAVGDVDGDGQWEYIVKWTPTNQADNSFRWKTAKTYYDCYKEDGTRLWRIDMGINIRSGNHYNQFLVYDFDGDGKAEMMVKTAPGTKDGQGKYVIMGSDDPTANYRTSTSNGTILSGPEYLTVFNGATGAEMSTIAYNPPRNIRSDWGDSYGNRCERYLAGVAYLDGQKPSAVFCRGYYTHAYLWAVDFDGTALKERWLHASTTSGSGAYGEGAHSLTVGDIDGDGCDEIVYGACAIDHDGKLKYRTGGGHGDALHMGDLIPEREGLEVFMTFEEKRKWDCAVRDAGTGEILYSEPASCDNGRGVAANVTALYPGYEWWSQTGNLWAGYQILSGAKVPDKNFRVYWDGDLLDELYEGKDSRLSSMNKEGTYLTPAEDGGIQCNVTKPNESFTKINKLINFADYGACHSFYTKRVPLLQADLYGDWREEMIFFDTATCSELMIFSTPLPTSYKVNTLMQDRQYRLAVAWQNVAYNQPPHLGYNLEESFNLKAAITTSGGTLNQVLYVGDPLQPVKFTVERATGVEAHGLPEGVTCTFDAATLTGVIEGAPKAQGEYDWYLTTTGADGNKDARIEGTFNVRVNTSLSLIAYYPFDKAGESTPNLIEGQATPHDVSLPGTPAPGCKGGALALAGGASYEQPHYERLAVGDAPFTVEMWFNSTAAETNCYLINKGFISNTLGTGNWWGIEYKNKELRLAIDDDVVKSQIQCAGADKYFDGQWHHIVGVRDSASGMMYLYIDGEQTAAGTGVKDGALTGAIVTDEPLAIGNTTTFDNPFEGMLDELCIYRGAMTAAKALERYQAGAADHLAYLPMDEVDETSTPNRVSGRLAFNGEGAPTVVQGVLGGALRFEGDCYLTQTVYDGLQLGEGDFSIEMWVRSTDRDGYLMCLGTHNTSNVAGGTGNWVGLERLVDASKNVDRLTFSIDDNVTKTDCQVNAPQCFDGEWHHLVAVRDFAAKTLTLYIDGHEAAVKTGVGTGAITFAETELLHVGGSDELTEGREHRTFDGDLDELAIHPRALTADEVEQAYAMLRPVQSAINAIAAAGPDARFTVIDAMSGYVMGAAVGADRTDIIDRLPCGVYLLVIERTGAPRQTFKFIKR